MTDDTPAQNLANHTRWVPPYHFFALSVLALNVLWSLYLLFTSFGFATVMNTLLAVALVLVGFYARVFALRVQDRLIRLEMRWRLAEVLPADLNKQFDELSKDQLISLRFASDAELPDLMAAVLEDGEQSRSAIKQRIKDWQPDHWRA